MAGLGGLGALAVAWWGGPLLVAGLARQTDVLIDLRPDWRVLAATAAAAVMAGLAVSMAPLWAALRAGSTWQQPGRSGPTGLGRFGQALIVGQVALSVVLLTGAGLLVRSFVELTRNEPGFARGETAQVSLAPRLQGAQDDAHRGAYMRSVIERVGQLPGVESAALSSLPLLAGREEGWRESVALRNGQTTALATLVPISPEFLRTLGLGLVRGREFSWSDDTGRAGVALADENLARRLGADVLGARVRFGVQPEFEDLTIVGVARSARLLDPRDGGLPVLYVPLPQHPGYGEAGQLLVRGRRPGALAQAAARTVEALGRETPTAVRTLDEAGHQALGEERALAALAAFVGAMALLLAATGLFGLISYATSRQRREMGIRLALGSTQRGLGALVVLKALRLTGIGLAAGLPCALAAAHLLQSRLYDVAAYDPLTLAAASAALALAAAAAAYVPARRAMGVDPAQALRGE